MQSKRPAPREGFAPLEHARLFYREIGQGRPIIVLHGGPDLDHTYLLPEMDHLADDFRLIYYDQRGCGQSAAQVQPDDLDRLREYFQLDAVAVLGHSWGGLLAMEYVLRHPDRVSHLILMNSIFASHDDRMLFRQEYLKRLAGRHEQMQALASTAQYEEGDPDTVAAYYRVHYSAALKHPDQLDRLMDRLRASFTKESILKGRAIEDRLSIETLWSSDYTLLLRLALLCIPTLVLHGEDDLVLVACAAHIAEAVPGARLVVLKDCGHFSCMESPNGLRQEVTGFFAGTN